MNRAKGKAAKAPIVVAIHATRAAVRYVRGREPDALAPKIRPKPRPLSKTINGPKSSTGPPGPSRKRMDPPHASTAITTNPARATGCKCLQSLPSPAGFIPRLESLVICKYSIRYEVVQWTRRKVIYREMTGLHHYGCDINPPAGLWVEESHPRP